MQLVVVADDDQREEIRKKNINPDTELIFINDIENIADHNSAIAILLLDDKMEDFLVDTNKPVIINSTAKTLNEIRLPANYSRINGWPGFLQREIWELATNNEQLVKPIFEESGWKYKLVKDEPGLVSGRIISMIINEAWFAWGDDVSSKEEIDNAMKLGTNYPFGPFEWGEKIGLEKIYDLLKRLSEKEQHYQAAPALEKFMTGKKF